MTKISFTSKILAGPNPPVRPSACPPVRLSASLPVRLSARPPVHLSTRQEILGQINRFSAESKPFVFAINFPGEKGFVLSPEEAACKGIRYDFGKDKNTVENNREKQLDFGFFPVSHEIYEKAYEKVQFHLRRGDTYLLNLTFPSRLKVNLSLSELFDMSRAPFRLYVPDRFVVFSPEAFVRIEGHRISSCPMKGTIDASLPDAEKRLLSDEKEFFEHNTIVDLIRNDLSMISTGVKVARFRYLDRIHTNRGDLLQMSSEITGVLPWDYRRRLGELLFRLLPAGSVTGAPKEKTVEIIYAAEICERGFYTGIFGYFDGNSLTTAVSIRFIEETGEGLFFRSGGGITALSDMKTEYEEMVAKVYVPVV